MNEFIKLIESHTSKRAFSDKKVDDAVLKSIIKAGQHASSSSFIQAYSVINVIDNAKRAKIAECAGGQVWVEKAPIFLVWCADLTRVNEACEKNDAGSLEGYSEHFLASTVDVALAAQTSLLAAESLGLGGVFIGGIRNNPQLLVDIFNLPKNIYPVFGMCLGYPEKTLEVKPRFDTEDILYTDEYNADTANIVHRYDEKMRHYYSARSSNSRISDWSAQTSNAVQGKVREHIFTFLQQQGFLKK